MYFAASTRLMPSLDAFLQQSLISAPVQSLSSGRIESEARPYFLRYIFHIFMRPSSLGRSKKNVELNLLLSSGESAPMLLLVAMNISRFWLTAFRVLSITLVCLPDSPTNLFLAPPRFTQMVGMSTMFPAAFEMIDFPVP